MDKEIPKIKMSNKEQRSKLDPKHTLIEKCLSENRAVIPTKEPLDMGKNVVSRMQFFWSISI